MWLCVQPWVCIWLPACMRACTVSNYCCRLLNKTSSLQLTNGFLIHSEKKKKKKRFQSNEINPRPSTPAQTPSLRPSCIIHRHCSFLGRQGSWPSLTRGGGQCKRLLPLAVNKNHSPCQALPLFTCFSGNDEAFIGIGEPLRGRGRGGACDNKALHSI